MIRSRRATARSRPAGAASVLSMLAVVGLAGGLSCSGLRWRSHPFPRTGPYLLNGTGSPDPVQVMDATGLRWFTFAFITAPADGACRATWNGWEELSTADIEYRRLQAIRARGGDAIVSFGGSAGTKLGTACTSVDTLVEQYRRVIELYRPRAIDLDLEGEELTDTGRHRLIVDALVRITREVDVAVSVTLPVHVRGLDGPGRAFFDTARARGLQVDNWTGMTFAYGQDRYDAQLGRNLTMVEATERSVDALAMQVAKAHGLDLADAYRLVGLSSMNGRTDFYGETGEVVTPGDFRAMRGYAQDRGLGRFTYWSLNRDRPCHDRSDTDQEVSSRCSHLDQPFGVFTEVAADFGRGEGPDPLPASP